jgi:decaprenyl-phosphate phosphoribosyltransferase
MSPARGLVQTLRPHQWVKNLFVAAPLVFAKQLTDTSMVLRAAAAVAAFCLLSGAVYALNDVLDVEKDRAHPTKRNRPVASGAISSRFALSAAAVLATLALGGAAALGWQFAAVAAGYLVINLLYSLQTKHWAYLDVVSVSVGFLLRVLGGAYALPVPASPWLLVCTLLLAAFLGFGKRAHELAQAQGDGEVGKTRRVLQHYRLEHIRTAMMALGVGTTAAYVFYTQAPHTVTFFGTRNMIFTAPFCALGMFRFLLLANRRTGESPTEEMLRDGLFMLNLVLWGAAVLAIIYYR